MAASTLRPGTASDLCPIHVHLRQGSSALAYLASLLINTGQVDLGNELDRGRDVGVFVAAVDVEAVDTVLVGTLHPELFQQRYLVPG